MSSVLNDKSIETEVSPLSFYPSHPLEGFLAGTPDESKESARQIEMALIKFMSAVEKYEDAGLDYIVQPSRERWDVVVSRGDDAAKAMSEFADKMGIWKDEWFSTFHQAVPMDALGALFRAIASLMPPVRPVIVTELIAIAFVAVDKAKRYALSLLKRWVDAWTLYIKYPTEASWSDVAKSWHELQEAVRKIDEHAEKWEEKLSLATPPEDSRIKEEARKVRRVINAAIRDRWRESRQKARDRWRENRWS